MAHFEIIMNFDVKNKPQFGQAIFRGNTVRATLDRIDCNFPPHFQVRYLCLEQIRFFSLYRQWAIQG